MIKGITRREFEAKFPEVSTYGVEQDAPVYLENGTVLTSRNWNGEVYTIGSEVYRPVQELVDEDQWETVGYELV